MNFLLGDWYGGVDRGSPEMLWNISRIIKENNLFNEHAISIHIG